MYLSFNIGLYECENQAVIPSMIEIMQNEGFQYVDSDQIRQDLAISEETLNYHEINEQLMIRKFLVISQGSKWVKIYPSSGWFSETQDLTKELSKRLKGVVMALLVDDSYGWGYDLVVNGQVIDRFHTDPLNSPRLQEKNRQGVKQDEIKSEDYVGTPSIISNIFDVDDGKVAYYLTSEENVLKRRPLHEKMRLFFKLLDIPDGDGIYDYLYDDFQNSSNHNWSHLIFARHLTDEEMKWRKVREADFPFAVPPQWLNK